MLPRIEQMIHKSTTFRLAAMLLRMEMEIAIALVCAMRHQQLTPHTNCLIVKRNGIGFQLTFVFSEFYKNIQYRRGSILLIGEV